MKYSTFFSKTKQNRVSYISEIGKCVHKIFESTNTNNDDASCVCFKCPIDNFIAIDNNLRLYALGCVDKPISIEEIDWFTLVKLHVVFSVKGASFSPSLIVRVSDLSKIDGGNKIE